MSDPTGNTSHDHKGPRRGRPSGRPLTHRDLPVQIPNASRFSPDEHPEFFDPLWTLRAIKAQRHIYEPLVAATTFDVGGGRPRLAGNWILVALVFTMSAHGAMAPFHAAYRTYDAFWRECGFVRADGRTWVPSYATFCARLAELEDTRADEDDEAPVAIGALESAAAELIARARRHEPAIGRHLMVDGTHYRTHAAARHDCGPGDQCADAKVGKLAHLDTKLASAMRHRQAELDDPDEVATVRVGGLSDTPITEIQAQLSDRPGVRYRAGGCWWYTRDPDAGLRAYTAKDKKVSRAWVGGYGLHAFDYVTGAMVAARCQPASVNEHAGYQELMDSAIANLGQAPLAVAVDRGFYVTDDVYRWGTERGIATVGPHKRRRGEPEGAPAPAGPRWDSFGDPTCAHCGGRTRRVGFSCAGGRSRIWFVCQLPQGPECEAGRQVIDCAADHRRLIPISRRSAAYRAISRARGTFERGHKLYRERYLVAANSLKERPKRLGLGPRWLRSACAIFLDWLRVCHRAGWLGARPRRGAVAAALPVPDIKHPARRRKAAKGTKSRGRPPNTKAAGR